jgi:hypothetical protein
MAQVIEVRMERLLLSAHSTDTAACGSGCACWSQGFQTSAPGACEPSGPGSSSAPCSRSQHTQPLAGNARTRLAPATLHSAALPCAVTPSKKQHAQQGIGELVGVECMPAIFASRWLRR